jgi:CHASE3 domain sensor protein
MKKETKNLINWSVLFLIAKPIAYVCIVTLLDAMQKYPDRQLMFALNCLLITLAVIYVYWNFGIALGKMIFKKKVKK